VLSLAWNAGSQEPKSSMTFFITSVDSGKGAHINARGDTPNMHDILTGSQPDGRAFAGSEDMTCCNWTTSSDGASMVSHHDRKGLRDDESSRSWNSSHASRGCSQQALHGSGGNSLFY
jgi:hypothetical protein